MLRLHLLEKEPISKLCDEVGLQPTVLYRWQKEIFENGATAFEQKARSNHSTEQKRRHRGGESNQRMARVGAGGNVVEVERQAVEEGHGL